MPNKMSLVVPVVVFFILLAAMVQFFPWQSVNWGEVSIQPAETITVSGTAKREEANQIAMFTAGMNSVKDNREDAIKEVNTMVDNVVKKLKEFGIEEDDIKTQNLSVYRDQEMYYEEGRQRTRQGQWRVSNTIEVRLRDVDRANGLVSLLTESGLNNVYGPNFMLDDTSETQVELLDDAMKDAKKKAEKLAELSGKKVVKVLVVNEIGDAGGPIMPFMREAAGGGGGGGVSPGTGTVQKTISVMFEVK